jgi:hypothetical protein
MTIRGTAGRARVVAPLVIAALLAVPAVDYAAGPDAVPGATAASSRDLAWLARAQRTASTEAALVDPQAGAARPAGERCGASTAEKLAWLWLLGSGTVMVITGPREKDAGHWYNDSKSEGIAGAVSIVLSFALLRDIRKQRAACTP